MRLDPLEAHHLAALAPQPAQARFRLSAMTDREVRLHLESRPAFAALAAGERVIGVGGLLHRPGGWPLVWLILGEMTRREAVVVRAACRGWLAGCRIRRLEADLDPAFPEHGRFAYGLGFRREGLRRMAGKDHRDLELWAWLEGT